MTANPFAPFGIQPRRVIHRTPVRSGPIADLTNYAHSAVINLIDPRDGSVSQYMVRMGARNEGSRKSYILWGHRVGQEMNRFRYQDPDYFEVFAMEIADRAPDQAGRYSNGSQERRCFETAEGSGFKYRQRPITRLTQAQLAKFNGNTYTEILP